MHKTASPRIDVTQTSKLTQIPNQGLCQGEESARANPTALEGIGRRDFIKRTGLAVAGLTTASTLLAPVRRMNSGRQPFHPTRKVQQIPPCDKNLSLHCHPSIRSTHFADKFESKNLGSWLSIRGVLALHWR